MQPGADRKEELHGIVQVILRRLLIKPPCAGVAFGRLRAPAEHVVNRPRWVVLILPPQESLFWQRRRFCLRVLLGFILRRPFLRFFFDLGRFDGRQINRF